MIQLSPGDRKLIILLIIKWQKEHVYKGPRQYPAEMLITSPAESLFLSLIFIRLDSCAYLSPHIPRIHPISLSFIQLASLASSSPRRLNLSLSRSMLLPNEIQMSLLDLYALLRDQKTVCNLIKISTSSPLSHTYLITDFLVNLITLIPVDMSGNFHAKRTCVQCCAVVRLETDPLLLSMSSTCFFISLTSLLHYQFHILSRATVFFCPLLYVSLQ